VITHGEVDKLRSSRAPDQSVLSQYLCAQVSAATGEVGSMALSNTELVQVRTAGAVPASVAPALTV